MSLTAYGTGKEAGGCQWCGLHHGPQCPSVKAIEYHPNGAVKRVLFHSPVTLTFPPLPYPLPGPDGWKIT